MCSLNSKHDQQGENIVIKSVSWFFCVFIFLSVQFSNNIELIDSFIVSQRSGEATNEKKNKTKS